MFKISNYFISKSVIFCIFIFPFFSASAFPNNARAIPTDSFILLSLKAKSIFEKSNLRNSVTWSPLLESFSTANPSVKEFLIDANARGLNLNLPLHVFARLEGSKRPDPVIGGFASIKDTKLFDVILSNTAENLGLSEKPSLFPRYGSDKVPYEIGRKGKFAYIMIIIQSTTGNNKIPNDVYLDKIVDSFSINKDLSKLPNSLNNHLSSLKDISIYFDGSGIGRLLELFGGSSQWSDMLSANNWVTNSSGGIHLSSTPGHIKVEFADYSEDNSISTDLESANSKLLDLLPGDSPVAASFRFDRKSVQVFTTNLFKTFFGSLLQNQDVSEFTIPGLNLTADQIFSASDGRFAFSLGGFTPQVIPPNERIPEGEVRLNPSFIGSLGVTDPLLRRQIAIGLESSNPIGSILRLKGIEVFEKDNSLWVATPDYKREINSDKPIRPLSKGRKEFLGSHQLAIDVDVLPLTQSVRKNRNLPFKYFKTLGWIEKIAKARLYKANNQITLSFRFQNLSQNPLESICELIGQEIIDQKNAFIYQAIAQDDFNFLQQTVQDGALINANDHFGHSPLHYAAYKGNARFVDYLLSNGGNPNVRSKHFSTPLHSAAWGRNLKAAEILLEDGADVNARTDEGETPAMTAALRGEKDLLEILFSLSADPHAKDIHGSNLYDLASAGGHMQILDLLGDLKVKNNHPLHAAAGKGDLKEIKKLLKNGNKVDTRDAFGATPIIIATVSGKIDVVKFLLSKKANPMLKAKDGYTMMHAAAFSGNKELVKIAFELGLAINARYGNDGVTPVDVGEDDSPAMPFLRSLGGRRGWELGLAPSK